MKRCHIVGAGDFDPALLRPEKDDLILAADAGFAALKKAGIRADLFIGDGDSLGFSPQELPTVLLPQVKDDTDMLAAVREALQRGYRSIFLYGALGGKRFSHSLANLQTLLFLRDQGAEGTIVDENGTVSLLTEGMHHFRFSGGYFSLFAADGEAVVSISGAKYPLYQAILSPSFPLGVSNEGKGETRIEVHRGSVFLVEEP